MSGNHTVTKLNRKIGCEKFILIKPNTMGSPLNKVVYNTQLSAFCLTTGKPQMVVQLIMPRILCDNLSISVMHNPLPAVLLGFKCHQSYCDDTYAWSGGIQMCRVLFAAGSAQSAGERNGRPGG